jgi:hypothetical protein
MDVDLLEANTVILLNAVSRVKHEDANVKAFGTSRR